MKQEVHPQEVDIQHFLDKTKAEAVISEIEAEFKARGGKPVYSDIYKVEDGKEFEYVNYVQEGGGVLGVALVGYTYVLERLGFRFIKLAGTSAGAINTLLMAAVDAKNYPGKNYRLRSEMILDEMLRFDMWRLVDGHWFAKFLIGRFISKDNAYVALKRFIGFCVSGVVLYALVLGLIQLYQFHWVQTMLQSPGFSLFNLLGYVAIAVLFLQWRMEIRRKKKEKEQIEKQTQSEPKKRKTPPIGKQIGWVLIFLLAVKGIIHLVFYQVGMQWLWPKIPTVQPVLYTLLHIWGVASVVGLLMIILAYVYFQGRFARAGFGINPGDEFTLWMIDILKRNGIETNQQLCNKMEEELRNEHLQLRADPLRNAQENTTNISGPLFAMMASDITLKTKAEFPRNARDYWANPSAVNPAYFVRASMSIPVFFSPFKINVPDGIMGSSRLWHQKGSAQALEEALDHQEIWMVDGGVLSNFPINIFHNPQALRARMPTFGVKLEDEPHIDAAQEQKKKNIGFGQFLGSVFSTIRFYYDKDFLSRNAIYEKGIAHIDVENINWLNFGMDEATKIDLFNRGVEAAKTFFLGGKYWVDGMQHDTHAVAADDEMGEAFRNGFNWQAFKDFRQKAIEKDMKLTDHFTRKASSANNGE